MTGDTRTHRDCAVEGHVWQERGVPEVLAEFPTKTQGRRLLVGTLCRCAASNCRQDGFRKPGSRVVYTWRPDPADWEK